MQVSRVLMIRPVSFKRNEQTVSTNFYQKNTDESDFLTQQKALKEFDSLVKYLKEIGVNVIVVQDTKKPETPDAIFPNNWISFHKNKTVCVYPMFAKNRRLERREDILKLVESKGFSIKNIIDYTVAETESVYLEGTGSMVLDRENKIAYCALSARSNEELFIEFCEDLEYTPVIFTAYHSVNGKRLPIYHTNVMMSVSNSFVMVCLDAIDAKKERKQVLKFLKQSDKEIIHLTENQIANFAGNTLELQGKDAKYLVMSKTAKQSLSNEQINQILKYDKILVADVATIEKNGGGSVRCMLAEVF